MSDGVPASPSGSREPDPSVPALRASIPNAAAMRERLARVACRAHGRNPDECVQGSGVCGPSGYVESVCYRYAWQDYAAVAAAVQAEFATFLRERSDRLQAHALDVELTIAEMLAASGIAARSDETAQQAQPEASNG